MGRTGGWVRLAAFLSALWLLGISLYAAYGWFNAFTVDSPFVNYVIEYDGKVFGATRLPPAGATYIGTLSSRFHWAWFLSVTGTVFAAIWVLVVGPAWVVNGFKKPASP